MKICILSMQRVNNFGSLLQSYALKKILESLGHRVKFIDINPNPQDDFLVQMDKDNYSYEQLPQKNLKDKMDKYLLIRINHKLKNMLQEVKFEEFRRRVLEVKENTNNEEFDLCVIGSDEVFNCLTQSPWGFTSQLFGNVKQAREVITYAASCGTTTVEKLPESVKERIKESFKNLKAISVRDENTGRFVSALGFNDFYFHLDPVLIGDFKNELKSVKLPYGLPKRFCLVYAYFNRINSQEEIKMIQCFCKKNNLEIVSVGAPQIWIKKHIVVEPFCIFKLFKLAQFVITDTFHGTIFAAKYSSKFAIIIRESNNNKLTDLVKRLELKKHVIDQNNINFCDYEFERIKFKRLIQAERKKSCDYLKKYIL